MNIDLKKINWEPGKAPSQLQLMTLRIRKKSDPDEESSYITITEDLQVYTDGTILNPPVINDMEEETIYIFRVLNNDPAGGSFDMEFTTPGTFQTEPIATSYYPGAELAYTENTNFRDAMLPPPGPRGAYYSFEYTRTDWFGHYDLANLFGTPNWVKKDGLPGIQPTWDISLNMDNQFASDVNNQYAFGLHFYVAAEDLPASGTWSLISFSSFPNGDGVHLTVNCDTKKIHWAHQKGATFQEIVSTDTINTGAWNQVLVFRSSDITASRMWLNASTTFTGAFTAAGAPVVGQLMGGVSVGSPEGTFSRFYYTTWEVDDVIANMYLQPPYPVGILAEYYDPESKYTIPVKNLIKVENDGLLWTLPPDVPTGRKWFYVEHQAGTSPLIEVNILPIEKRQEPVTIDFANPEESPDYFNNLYYFMAKGWDVTNGLLTEGWGKANGGASHKHVYMQDGLLALEAHGDFYDGRSQGFNEDGTPKYHELPGDPSTPFPWITRVGAAISSKDYYGYGRYVVEAKLPPEMGVAPSFWVSHYAKVYPKDPRFEEMVARGLYVQGDQYNGEHYVVEKNEIDMELPSHNANRTFYGLDEMLSNIYVISWVGQTVAVMGDPDPANNGTWQLNNAAAPDQLASWTKINDEIQQQNQPRKDNARCTNWRGEHGFYGIGIAADDEFLLMLSSIGKNVWDGEFHEFRFDWYANRVEFYVDGEMIQVNRHFVPDVPGRWNIGLWFPSEQDYDRPWRALTHTAWAGPVAAWKYQKMLIRKIAHTPFSDTEAGGANRLAGETNPFGGLRTFPAAPED